MKLQVDVIHEGTLRVWVNRSGDRTIKSYSVDKMLSPIECYEIREDEASIQLITKSVILTVQKEGICLSYHKPDGTLLTQEYEDIGVFWEDDGVIGFTHKMKLDEHFYGLGEDNDAYLGCFDRRGSQRDMITGQRINIGHVTADIPISFFMSTDEKGNSYGIFCDTSYLMKYDMGKDYDDRYSFQAAGGDLIYYFFAQDDFKGILSAYTDITGKPQLLPRWSLGFIQSYCCYRTWPEIQDVIQQNEENQIPLDCMVIDFDWSKSTHNFEWDFSWEDKSREMMKEYRKKGIMFMLSNCGPMLKKDSINMQEAIEAGIMAKDTSGNLVTCGHYGGKLMDFFHPNMKDWLRPYLHTLLDDGIKAWWLDLTEPEGDIEETIYYDGPRKQVHNVYSLMNSKLYYELTKEYDPNGRPFILTRTGTAGIQKYGNAIWTGDVFSDYETLQAHCPEALNTTLSGIPNWTSDSGGFISSTYAGTDNVQLYKNDPGAHAMLYERWLQLSCFCPITRAHHVGPSAPYMFQELVLSGCRHYLQLRQRLLPYIYSYAHECEQTGMSIMRPLIYEYQQDIEVYNLQDEYLFGRELLVAPVMKEGNTQREVYFPSGSWLDWDYGYVYDGNHTYEIYSPQNRIPLFIKKGAIIPMLKRNYSNNTEAEMDILNIRIYPNQDSDFTLYMDDGETIAYQNGEYTCTQIKAHNIAGHSLKLCTVSNNNKFSLKEITYEILTDYSPSNIQIHGKDTVLYNYKTQLDDVQEGAYFDYFQKKIFVKLQIDDLNSQVEVFYNKEAFLPRTIKGTENKGCGQLPYLYPPATLPCRIQAENYDRGGEGIAYHIQNPVKNELFRNDDVHIIKSDDVAKGYVVHNLIKGDWLEYTVHVSENGKYDTAIRVKGIEEINYFTIDVNTQNMSGMLELKNSPNYQTIKFHDMYLSQGDQVIRIFVKEGTLDFNWFEISKK